MPDETKTDATPEVESRDRGDRPEPAAVDPSTLRGALPDDFPGHAALEEADLDTYGRVRHFVHNNGDLTSIAGIGEATANKILVAIGESQEGDDAEDATGKDESESDDAKVWPKIEGPAFRGPPEPEPIPDGETGAQMNGRLERDRLRREAYEKDQADSIPF